MCVAAVERGVVSMRLAGPFLSFQRAKCEKKLKNLTQF